MLCFVNSFIFFSDIKYGAASTTDLRFKSPLFSD